MNSNSLKLQVRNLVKYFPVTRGVILQRKVGNIHAVDNVSFNIYEGETKKTMLEKSLLTWLSYRKS